MRSRRAKKGVPPISINPLPPARVEQKGDQSAKEDAITSTMTDTSTSPLRPPAEAQFKEASAEAAFFELRMRMLAGTIPKVCDQPINVELSKVKGFILAHCRSKLADDEFGLVVKALDLRNKLLHCEFSTVRKTLDQLDPRHRDGGITKLDIAGLSGKEMAAKIAQVIAGDDVGQTSVADTHTKRLKDIFEWLHECQIANEFDEAKATFCQAIAILERLARGGSGGTES
jgi:hypothetical protein